LTYPEDDSKSNPVPDPEMNPLLNPLLAANMGRWAEVYFTTPPQKRAEAIAALIRELERAQPAAPTTNPAAVNPDLAHQPKGVLTSLPGQQFPQENQASATSEPSSFPAVEDSAAPHAIVCVACGHENPGDQRFCGMCGSPLEILPGIDEPYSEPAYESLRSAPDSFLGLSSAYSPGPVAKVAVEHGRFAEPELPPYERSLPSFAVAPPSLPYRYRMYVGAILAIALTTLIYVAWRGKRVFSGSTQSLSSTGMPAAEPAPPAPSPAVLPPDSANPGTPNATASPGEANARTASAATPETNKGQLPATAPPEKISEPGKEPGKQQPAETPHQPAQNEPRMAKLSPRPEAASASSTTDTGGQEFAIAQRFLNGGPGSARDSREAAAYLWRAVSKGNVAATITLSDLYLHGDGVPQSCDQARLLLDAAAGKGAKAAAVRLRNLQAFGCQ
jgi:hypothetical protein